jgi:uncharacterized Zn finger protein
MSERVGTGPWARLVASAIVRDEGSSTAERGRVLARAGEVDELDVRERRVTARVGGCEVVLSAEPVPPRIWTAMVRAARGNPPLEEAVAGKRQSVQLEHLMTVDWSAPLVPRAFEVGRACTCDGANVCEHVAAVAFAFALAIDDEPLLLLRWRGCVERASGENDADGEARELVFDPDDEALWHAEPLPEPPPLRPLPVGAVLKRLGTSGIEVRGEDLSVVLHRAYESFAESAPD